MRRLIVLLCALISFSSFCFVHAYDFSHAQENVNSYLTELQSTAEKLARNRPAENPDATLVTDFLASAKSLSSIEPRTIYFNKADRIAITTDQYDQLDESKRGPFKAKVCDDALYYGYFSTPLAWTRPLELLSEHGVDSIEGKRILDFGFGNIGQLKMFASMGADVTGIEVNDGIHSAMYAEADQGPVDPFDSSQIKSPGSLSLVFGQWPAEKAITNKVGHGYDFFISKNVLKLGYIHPERKAPKRMLIDLGVDDATFLSHVYEAMNPDGVVLVYNIHPPQSSPDEQYKPWAYGETPWQREQVEAAGFNVIAWHVDDTEAIHDLGVKLGWNANAADDAEFEKNFRAMVTILKKPFREK